MNYYAFSQDNFSLYDANSYHGCGNVDPIDDVPCRKNFVLIITSGLNLSSGSPAVGPFPQGTAGCNETNPLVQNACVGFNADLRNDPDGSKPGKQNVYTYVVSTTTDTVIKTILQQTAVAGGGANQFYDASDTSNLPQQLKNAINDILGRAASGTAVSVLTTSSRGIGSMVQAYFLPTSKAGPSETRDVVWTGYLQNLWIDPQDNLREDTVNDFQLKLDEDKVVKLFFDETLGITSAATFNTDQNGNGGTLATCTPQIEGFSSVKYLWEAGRQLAVKAPDSRTLFTAKKVIQGSSSPVTFSVNNFTATTVGSDATFKAALNPDPDGGSYDASKIVAYIRGECLETGMTGNTDCGSTANNIYRDRRMVLAGGATNGNVWKLGDIISSTPRVFANTPLNTYHVDYGDDTYRLYISDTSSSSSYRNHSSLAFVGANDGVLHAFRVGFMQDTGLTAGIKALFKNFFNSTSTDRIGEEVWGYIPFNAFPYLKYLANTGYCHLYYNDLSVRLVDVSIGAGTDNATTTKTMNSWRTVLLGGMRFGGACSGGTPAPPTGVTNTGFSAYYAIDITDPENPVPMWEFSDADLGYAASYPAVIRTGDTNVNGNWYVAFGSGSTTQPKSETDIARTAQGYIYILNLKTGELVKKIPLGFAAIVGDVLAIDADKNYSSEEIYFGTSYKSGSTWAGKLMGIGIPNQDLSTWSNADAQTAIVTLFADNYPVTASPDATVDTDGAVWVFAGSGKYYSDIDESDTNNQVFLGLKHKATGITYPRSTAAGSLDDKTNVTTTGTVAATTKECLYSSGTFTLQDVVTSIFATSPEPAPSTVGWFLSLTGGERVISRPLAVGGLADFLTYVPSSDPCSYGGNSKLYAVGYTTGVAPTTVAIYGLGAVTGTQGTGIGQSVTVHKGIALGPGAPPTGEAIIIPPPKEGQESLKKKIQVATGVIVEAENQPVTSVISKVVHWLKK